MYLRIKHYCDGENKLFSDYINPTGKTEEQN